LPLLTGRYRAHHSEILALAEDLASSGKVRPLVNEMRFMSKDIASAYALVESNVVGKIVVEMG
jgi:NADPH2:quinone reductase